MMFKSQTILMLALSFSILACGKPAAESTQSQELDDRNELLKKYEPLVGLYAGTLSDRPDGETPIDVQLKIYIADEQSGLNEKGEPKFRPVLKARYTRLDLEDSAVGGRTLNLRLYDNTSDLVGSTSSTSNPSSGASTSDAGSLSFSGKIQNTELIIEFRDHRGIVGNGKLKKI